MPANLAVAAVRNRRFTKTAQAIGHLGYLSPRAVSAERSREDKGPHTEELVSDAESTSVADSDDDPADEIGDEELVKTRDPLKSESPFTRKRTTVASSSEQSNVLYRTLLFWAYSPCERDAEGSLRRLAC